MVVFDLWDALAGLHYQVRRLVRAIEVATVARAAGIVCNVNGAVGSGIGNRADIAPAAAAPPVTLTCVVPVSTPAEAQSG